MASEIENAVIDSVSIEIEDHGSLTMSVHLSGAGWAQNAGGFSYNNNPDLLAKFLRSLFECLRVRNLHALKRQVVRIRRMNGCIEQIGHAIDDEWLDIIGLHRGVAVQHGE